MNNNVTQDSSWATVSTEVGLVPLVESLSEL